MRPDDPAPTPHHPRHHASSGGAAPVVRRRRRKRLPLPAAGRSSRALTAVLLGVILSAPAAWGLRQMFPAREGVPLTPAASSPARPALPASRRAFAPAAPAVPRALADLSAGANRAPLRSDAPRPAAHPWEEAFTPAALPPPPAWPLPAPPRLTPAPDDRPALVAAADSLRPAPVFNASAPVPRPTLAAGNSARIAAPANVAPGVFGPHRAAFAGGLPPAVNAAGQDLVVDVDHENSPYPITAGDTFRSVTVGSTSAGVINHSAGTLSAGNFSLGGPLNPGGKPGGVGTYNLSGTGTLVAGPAAAIGSSGTGIFNQNGGSVSITGGNPLNLAVFGGSAGTYNLNAGTLTAPAVSGGKGASTFNLNGGTLQAGANSATFFQGLTAANVQSGGARIDTSGYYVTAAQPLLHGTNGGSLNFDGGLTKLGAGTLTLTGASTYVGPTTVSAGTLTLSTGGSITGFGFTDSIQVNAGAALIISGTGSLQRSGLSIFTVDGSSAAPASVALNGAGSVSVGTTYIGEFGAGVGTQTGGSFDANGRFLSLGDRVGSSGTYTLSGGSLNAGQAYIGLNGTGTFTQSGGSFALVPNNPLVIGYTPSGSGAYTLHGGSLSTGAAYVGGSGTGTFTQTGGSFSTNGNPLILSSPPDPRQGGAGSGTYNLNGGTLTVAQVAGSNAGVGGTSTFNFNGGTLQAGASSAVFFQGLTAANVRGGSQGFQSYGGAVIDTNGFNVTVAQPLLHSTISGDPANDGGLQKNGAGTLTLTGAGTYNGPTYVNAGTLAANNPAGSATGSGLVSVAAGAALTGTGTLAGSVLVNGGLLDPGMVGGPGRLSVGEHLVLGAGGSGNATFALELGGTVAGTGYDQAVVGSGVSLQGADLRVAAVNGFTLAVGQRFFVLDTGGGPPAVDGVFSNAPGGLYTDAAGDTFRVNYADTDPAGGQAGSDVSLTVVSVAVPEPGAWTLAAVGAAALLALRARRRD